MNFDDFEGRNNSEVEITDFEGRIFSFDIEIQISISNFDEISTSTPALRELESGGRNPGGRNPDVALGWPGTTNRKLFDQGMECCSTMAHVARELAFRRRDYLRCYE